MSRKNSRVRSQNAKGRLNRRQKGEARLAKADRRARVNVESMVIPDGKCYLQSRKGKAIFLTEDKARAALRQAQYQRARINSGHVEKRFYPCPDGGCGGYHLTSREEYDPAWGRKDGAA